MTKARQRHDKGMTKARHRSDKGQTMAGVFSNKLYCLVCIDIEREVQSNSKIMFSSFASNIFFIKYQIEEKALKWTVHCSVNLAT